MEKIYVYDWLDKLSSYDLNPDRVYPGTIGQQEAAILSARIVQEVDTIEQQLKTLFFGVREGEQLSLMVNNYHDMLIVIMNRVHQHQHHPQSDRTGVTELLAFLMGKLEGLLHFFEQNFPTYLHRELRVPMLRSLRTKGRYWSNGKYYNKN